MECHIKSENKKKEVNNIKLKRQKQKEKENISYM